MSAKIELNFPIGQLVRCEAHPLSPDVRSVVLVGDVTFDKKRGRVRFTAAGGEGSQGPEGPAGPQGDVGPQGPEGPQGIQGETGPQGSQGESGDGGGSAGASAYEVAVANGFVGTGTEWLASLVGEQGEQGLQGVKGDKGDAGDAGDAGQQGLKGDTGDTGSQGLQGDTGPQGEPGADGAGVTQQAAIANVSRNGNASTQTQNLQNKVDEILGALRAAGVIAT